MKKIIVCAVIIGGTMGSLSIASAQVSVNVGVPGVYGRVDIGGYPTPPPVLYRQPAYVERVPAREPPPPLYLHVPPGHEKHWRQHCSEYDACGRPVYFVQHDWYRNVYSRRGDGDRHDDHRGDGDRHDDHRGDRHERHDDRDGRQDNGRGREHQ